jgi:putative transposase
MPRRARLAVPGVPWHIIQRGNNRSACFYADEDYLRYLHHLGELATKFGCAIHAYVLMTNHVHLLLTPEREDSCALLMKHLGQRYVQYINRSYRRSGTLWEGRFKSCLTQTEDYVLSCYRYIEMNPVRVAMVQHPDQYRWSSYRANAEGKADAIVTPHEMYSRLGADDAARQQAYQQLFHAHLEQPIIEQIRSATNGNYVLGTSRFQEEIGQMLGKRVAKAKAGRPAQKQGLLD